ncbi:MAG: thiol-disulfide oxidoreductase DCC family protein [Bacteroidales bacterium]|nr:thiol-disulfide oxidoreductase DCC family protein [Bacteroidales bacterium]
MPEIMQNFQQVVLFDGVCKLCNGFINFIIKADRHQKIRFMALQNPKSKNLLTGLPGLKEHYQELSSVVFIDTGMAFVKSDAVLKILAYLPYPWRAMKLFKFLPKYLRDKIYDFIASHRYGWFGKKQQCMVPSQEVLHRFIV